MTSSRSSAVSTSSRLRMVRIEGSRRVCTFRRRASARGVVASGTCSSTGAGSSSKTGSPSAVVSSAGASSIGSGSASACGTGASASAAVSDTFFLREVRLGFAAGGSSTAWGFGSEAAVSSPALSSPAGRSPSPSSVASSSCSKSAFSSTGASALPSSLPTESSPNISASVSSGKSPVVSSEGGTLSG